MKGCGYCMAPKSLPSNYLLKQLDKSCSVIVKYNTSVGRPPEATRLRRINMKGIRNLMCVVVVAGLSLSCAAFAQGDAKSTTADQKTTTADQKMAGMDHSQKPA